MGAVIDNSDGTIINKTITINVMSDPTNPECACPGCPV
jgi:hypothetical protein